MTLTQGFRRSRAGGNPVSSDQSRWVPASAGMTPDTESLGSNA